MTRKNSQNYLVGGIIIIIVISGLLMYSFLLNQKLSVNTRTFLSELSVQGTKTINSGIYNEWTLLKELSSKISNNNTQFDVDQAIGHLEKAYETYSYKSIGIIMQDGTTFNHEGITIKLDLSTLEDNTSLLGKTTLTGPTPDAIDGKDIFVYSAPIFVGEEIPGVLFATYDINHFISLMSVDSFNGEGYSYIVQSDGAYILKSDHPTSFQETENIFKSINNSSTNNNRASLTLQEDMSKHKSGQIVFTNQVDKYMQYTPLAINDWYLLSVVPVNIADKTASSIFAITIFLCIIILIAIIAFMLYFSLYKKKTEDYYDKLLYVDPITGGPSYEKFLTDVRISLSQNKGNAAYAVLDIENFNLIREKYGHGKSNEIIAHIYSVIKQVSKEGTTCARRGEDSFALLIHFSSRSELIMRIKDFSTVLLNSKLAAVDHFILRPLFGIFIIDDPSENIMRMQNLARMAQHSIKYGQLENYAFHDDVYRDALMYNKELEDQMILAFKNKEFIPYFQPKYDTSTRKIVGAEALIRWVQQDGSMIYPNVFIPLAEENGFIIQLDAFMFEKVCERQRYLIDKGYTPVPISVNLSRKVLRSREFIDKYISIMKHYNIPQYLVEIEITESAMLDNNTDCDSIVRELHEKGFKILVDDFGTGYSSLMMLKSMPIDALKLDKSFIDDYNDHKGSKIIVCIIEMAKSLSMPITAEGVETESQYDFLNSMSCDTIQGYYFARPMAFESFEEHLSGNFA